MIEHPTDFPVICSECQGHVWISEATDYQGNAYCKECAELEPESGNED